MCSSQSRTPATAWPQRRRSACSTASGARMTPAPARAAAPASASRSHRGSFRRTAARSGPKTAAAAARESPSRYRSPRAARTSENRNWLTLQPSGRRINAAATRRNRMRIAKVVLGLSAAAALFAATPAFSAGPPYNIGPVIDISASCSSQNAEVEQAVDQKLGYVYEEWMGCRGIAFARSTDGGATFQTPISVPGSIGSNVNTWDPAVTVAPDGTVYAAFMIAHSSQWYPVVAASFDH